MAGGKARTSRPPTDSLVNVAMTLPVRTTVYWVTCGPISLGAVISNCTASSPSCGAGSTVTVPS